MYVDRNGQMIKSVHIWLPMEVHALVKEDGLNLSQFVRDQLEELYGEQSTIESLNRKVRLVETARGSLARQREIGEEASENRERLKATVRQLRAERRAEQVAIEARTTAIQQAIRAIVERGSLERYERALPQNDLLGDRVDVWDALVAGVSRRCGMEIDDAEVAAELQRVIAQDRRGCEV